ncbi:hypothetical protein I4F81_008730 [Pyropia yezoensis]|uniref:Uncharacterized protein n=1 Tax=Pyropia yezoensis TaxID=2788 RepID=A0ACC3C7B6_PYRYE|nr:hypothetical protein I4F81_008730 [Neopyropia yezoensis]
MAPVRLPAAPADGLAAAAAAATAAAVANGAAAAAKAASAAPPLPRLDDIPGRVAAALRSRGVDAVGHGGAAREVAAAAAAADFLRRHAAGEAGPVVASECPAVVLLATKRYGASVTAALGRGRSHVLRVAAAALLDVHLPPDHAFAYTPVRGRSARGGGTYYRETTVTAADGRRSLRFAYAYGYRHVQNVARRIGRPGAPPYDYVELLACGGGRLHARRHAAAE